MVGFRAMLVEDNPVDRAYISFLVRRLRPAGITLDEAATAEESAQLLRKNRYDLVISDHHLTGPVTGLDILNRLRQDQPKCRRMLLTGDSRDEIMAEAFWREAAERVVIKSAGSREIISNVRELLEPSV